MYYTLKDHQGSLAAVIQPDGDVERLSYDAWGRRRNPDGFGYDNVPPPMFDRGFTLHEHYDGFGLINMNGRMYDPAVGRMLSPDIVIQQEHNSQAYNRYSYCFNNPLRFTDPSGYVTEEGWYRDSQGKLKFDARVHSQMDLYSLGIPGIFENDDDWRPTPPDIGAFNTEDSEGTTKTMRTNLEPDGNDFMEVVGAFSTMGGFTASLKEYSLVDKSGKRWKGNSRWYSMDYYGRKTGPTGYQKDVVSRAEKANAVGKVFFAASVFISGFEIGNSIKEGDSDAVLLSGLDIGFGALGAFGGPYGFGFSAAYSFIKAVSTPSIIMDTKYQLKYAAPDKTNYVQPIAIPPQIFMQPNNNQPTLKPTWP